jgi:hypothetical protein
MKIKVAFILISFFVLIGIYFMFKRQQNIDVPQLNWKTENNLPLIQRAKSYQLLFLGSSHARTFSRFENHKRVEQILKKSIINLAQGGDRAGLVDQKTYLDYFYSRKNNASVVVYFIDPYIFYNDNLDNNISLYNNEPFRVDFFIHLFKIEQVNPVIKEAYITKLISPEKINSYLEFQQKSQDSQTSTISATMIKNRINTLYKKTFNREDVNDRLAVLMDTITLAHQHNSKTILIVPPTLLGQSSQDKYIFDKLEDLSNDYSFKFYNFGDKILSKKYYYDTDHLNTAGVTYFTDTYLNTILNSP